ncbi:MAG: dihydroneopterin aldolase [Muribaculaceae bacterium]|nr:dihydroneopterin aldolase [Muribaculaceae bacterium]
MSQTKTPVGTVAVEGLRIYAHHGVDPQETKVGNIFEVTVKVDFNAEHAMRSDRVDLTVSYADIVDIVKSEMAFPSKLLEHVCLRIYQNVTHRYSQITGGMIAIYKLQPPISAELDRAGFIFRW